MRVPVVIFGSEILVSRMDEKVWVQASNVAALPGIQQSVFVMPDAHSGYGFPAGSWIFTFTEKARHALSALPIPSCLLSFRTSANRY